jgi:two-component system phosphate regulon sensor histidine kinase PhoR
LTFSKPIQIIIGGSLVVAVLLGALVGLLCYFEVEFSPLLVFGLILTFGITTFLVFLFFIEKFLNNKITLIHKIIKKEKFSATKRKRIKLSDDVLEELTKETKIWATERRKEISKLREQAEFRTEFLGNLAHELKTPVFSIQGYILTLLEGGLEDESVNREFLLRASKGVDRMTDILEDLDEITRLESDRTKLNLKNFDIVELAKDVIDGLQQRADTKNISLRFGKDYSPIMVNADKGKISQVLTNLISNSISYGNETGETIIRFNRNGDSIMVEIADNGPGIEEGQVPRLFERFYRVDKSRARHIGGSGLGLAIVKHIIESHGHGINVRSTVGVGSTFSFELDKASK